MSERKKGAVWISHFNQELSCQLEAVPTPVKSDQSRLIAIEKDDPSSARAKEV